MSKQHLRILAIAILAIGAIFAIAQAQTVLAQEEPLCDQQGCDDYGCMATEGRCLRLAPVAPCVCSYPEG
jgi:hypothetical protein